MVTITLHCPHCESDALVRMVMHPLGNNSIAATPAVVKVARTRLPMPTQNLGVRRFCTPTKNEAVYVASLARLASLAPRCLVGSKKRS
jgi:hypothetical protein